MPEISILTVKGVATAALTIAASLFATSAQAFTFSTIGTWSNPIGGSSITYQTIGAENQIRWGSPVNNEKSGLGFAGNAGTANFGDTFQLGTLRHFNNPVFGGTSISGADLTVNLSFGGSLPIPAQNFLFNLAVQETPNETPCAYPSATPCADRISFPNLVSTNSFTVGDTSYSLELLGFRNTVGGALVNQFISDEGRTNQTALFGRVVETTAAVPEPMTIAGLALAGAGLARVRRRQAKG
jgi:hypothetical protein